MKWLVLAFQLMPSVLGAIVQIEQSVDAPGATKKSIIMGAISSAAKVGEQVPDQTTALISAFIDDTVTKLHATGSSGFAQKPVAVAA